MRAANYIMAATLSVAITGTIILMHIASPDLKQSLANITGHHWTAVSAISAISLGLMLVIVYILSARSKLSAGSKKGSGPLKADDLLGWSIAMLVVTLVMTAGTFALFILHSMGSL